MPNMGGLKCTKKIRKYLNSLNIRPEKQPYIIGLTGHVADQYTKAGKDAGMTDIFCKPLYFEVLE